MKIRIKGKKVPKAQVGTENCPDGYAKDASGNCVPTLTSLSLTTSPYNWMSLPSEQSTPQLRVTTVNSDGTKTTTGNTGAPQIQYAVSNQGTPTQNNSPIIAPPAKKSPFAKGYDSVMDPMRAIQKGLRKPFMQDLYGFNSAVNGVVDLATPIATFFDNKEKIRDARNKEMESRFNTLQAAPKFRGNFTVNEGLFRPDDRGVNEGMFGNNFYAPTMMYGGDTINETPMKIRIKNVPSMEYGGQTRYALDLGRRKVYTDMEETSSENASNSMGEVEGTKVLEAEQGETIWRPDGTHFNIGGDRHHSGGTKLTEEQASPGSFIFSDTKKMKIKDPQILAHFGMSYKKGGVTPAQIAKKFPLNDYKARMEDPTRQSDSISMKSDKLSWDKNMQKLAELAMVQEAMKGMPPPQMSQAVMQQAQMQQAAFGGYVMPKFQGAKGSSTVPTYQPGFKSAVLEPKKKEDYDLIFPQGFDEQMPQMQRTLRKGVYGKADWTDATHMADFAKRFPDFIKANPKWDPTKKGQTAIFQKWYNQNVDPTYFSGANNSGYAIDDRFGQHTWSAPAWNKKQAPPPPVVDTPKEETPGVDVPIDAPKEDFPKQKEVPFDFMAPDKINMAMKANQMIPNIYLPEMYQLPRRQYPMAFDDWMSRVQNRQATYRTAMDTAAKTNQSQSVGSFLAGLVGAQDTGDIAQVNSANLERADRRQMMDMEADFKNDVFNLGQRQEYSKGLATAQQQYDNAKKKGIADFTQAYADAWENRGDLYDINMRDPYFYRDPNSYKTTFKGAAGNIFGANASAIGTNGAGGWESLGSTANSLYKKFYDSLTYVEDKKQRATMAQSMVNNYLNGSRQTSTQSYDAYGMPRSSTKRTSRFSFSDDDE